MIRLSKSYSVLVALCSLACAASQPAFSTGGDQDDEEEPRRRVAGVALDPMPEYPAAKGQQHSSQVIVPLQAPQDPGQAMRIVDHFFLALQDGNYQAIEELLDERAWFRGGGGRQRAQDHFRIRLSQFDYASLGPMAVYRKTEAELYRAQDIFKIQPRRHTKLRPSGDEVMVKVSILRPRVGQRRLFGDDMTFLLRPKDGKFLIREIEEDFQLR